MNYKEIVEKVSQGSSFYVNFTERSVRLDGKIVVQNGNFDSNGYENQDTDFSLQQTLLTIEQLYQEYKHSVPSERSESHRRTYFNALPEKELSDNDMMYGERRETARALLEVYVLEAICREWLYWDEPTMGKWFWQSKKNKDLIILRQWIDPS